MRIISLKSTNMELTDAIRAYVEEKVDHLRKLTAEFEPTDDLSVEVGKSTKHHAKGPYFRAEMMLSLPGKDFRAELEAEDLYAAIDAVKDQMRRQITDYKERLQDKSHRATRPDKE